jgi:hypothetical protein
MNGQAEIPTDHALIYQDSADSQSMEWELAADGSPGPHPDLSLSLSLSLLVAG